MKFIAILVFNWAILAASVCAQEDFAINEISMTNKEGIVYVLKVERARLRASTWDATSGAPIPVSPEKALRLAISSIKVRFPGEWEFIQMQLLVDGIISHYEIFFQMGEERRKVLVLMSGTVVTGLEKNG